MGFVDCFILTKSILSITIFLRMMSKHLLLFTLFLVFLPISIASAKENQNPRKFGQSPTSAISVTETPKQGQIRSCQAHTESLQNRMRSMVRLMENMESKFEAITNRVKEFYTTKVVPSGKTVSNYDALLAEIQTRKTATLTIRNNAQNQVNAFNCEGDPKNQLNRFRMNMQEGKTALKEYRTAIKNLVVAVHSTYKEAGED